MTDGPKTIRIGGASGYWGDAAGATAQLLAGGRLDFIVYDYLAEITMGILARNRARDPLLGYATDFVTQAMAANLVEIAKQGVRVISNAGGVNPEACATAIRRLIADQGLSLSVATVTGDDLMAQIDDLVDANQTDMFTQARFPERTLISSANAYLGAFPIANALDHGADIVITGRCVDSAVTLAACIHAFGWSPQDFDLLAAGSLAGHILECGTQATGGNFTDWQDISGGFDSIGYPVATVAGDGGITVSKADNTGGLVSTGTVAEQIVYEISDPQAYMLPDACCDFSQVSIRETGPDQVAVSGARGLPPSPSFKTCLTWQDGFRGGQLFGYYGPEAEQKASLFADAALARSRAVLAQRGLRDFTATSVEILGAETQFGACRQSGPAREVVVKIAVRHVDAKGVGVFLKETSGLGLSVPPGLSGFAGTRPRPSPVMALFSFLVPKDSVKVTVSLNGKDMAFQSVATASQQPPPDRPEPPVMAVPLGDAVEVPLIRLAWARSGDKGDSANIGVIARSADYFPYIWAALDELALRRVYGHFLGGEVHRYLLPGLHAMNIVLTRVLGGGGMSSLRNDPQGKGYAQLLLAHMVTVPRALLKDGI